MYLSWFFVLAISVSPGRAVYQTDIFYRKTYKIPGLNDGALFGFSVSSIATGNKSKLLVGAPKQDNIGEVYACDPATQDCSPVSRKGINRYNEDYRYKNQSYWFGATVFGTKDYFVACAPRFVAKSMIYSKSVGIFGRCYSYDDSSASPKLLDTVPRHMLESLDPFETTMQTFGWSLNIDSDDSIYVGGPGMGSGRLMRIKSNKVDSTGYAYGSYSKFNASYNFGYSVTTGEFKPRGKSLESRMQVAVGSTYGRDGRGKVIFRTLTNISTNSTNELVGPVGSMYGAALCTASFNEDGTRSALLVGAPAFADYDGYNTGAVYVYTVAKRNGFLPIPITMFAGEASNSFFGNAILNVGDLNGDQKDEIAIAAPYFQNTGCVYIYSGAHLAMKGNKPDPLQKILPSSPDTRTFGYSLGLLKDYDDNGCDELAIGAPQTNEVTVLNCVAVITVKLLKLPNAITKSKGDKPESIDVCLEVQFPVKPEKVNAEINVKITIRHDGASLQFPANGLLDFLIDKKNKTRFCKHIELFLNGTGKYNKEILYDMEATQIPPKDKDFRPENVNLSVRSELNVAGLIWVQECGNNTCLPQLAMTTTYSKKSPYLIGSTPSIDTNISVVNTGDVAYDACLHINVAGAEITKLPNNCHTLASAILECKPRQPVYTGPNWNQSISIDTTSLTNENSRISVSVTLFNECGNASSIIKDEKKFTLKADIHSISIQGRTDEGDSNLVNLTRGDIAAQKQFHHVYTIGNSGPTNWVNLPLKLSVPKLDIATAAVYLANEKCKKFASSGDIDIYSCKAESISKGTAIQVNIIFTVVPDTLNAKIGREDIMVQSKINVTLNREGIEKYAEVISELRLVEGVIPIWIIITASILALIILVILFFILRECGCLKRKNKEELKKARMSVRRQTVMRKSLMGRPPSADQETLVREAEASHESDKKKKDRRVIINDF